MKLFADYHTHTVHSHGEGSVLDNVIAAGKSGLDAVGIADHGPASLFGVGIESIEELFVIKEEAAKAHHLVPDVEVLTTVEANVIGLNGEIDVPKRVVDQLDMLLCGFHHLVAPPRVEEGIRLFAGNFGAKLCPGLRERVRATNTKAIIEAVYRNPIDVITHPGLQMPIDTKALAKACAKRDTALEINTSHDNVTVDFIKLAKKEGARFAIDSDAHTPQRVGDLQRGLALAAKAGLEPSDVINAKPD